MATGTDTSGQYMAFAMESIGATRFSAANYLYNQGAPAAVNTTATMTAANLLTGIITSTTAAAVAGTLPLAADLETALVALFPAIQVNDAFEFSVISTGANTFTVTTNTGWTLVGNMAVATVTSSLFRAVRTAAGAYTLYRVG